MGGKKVNKQIQISRAEYDKLRSRPKLSTLARDSRQGKMRKGKRNNPYTQTLLDPIRITGVKVPDVTSFPTSTVQLYDRVDFVTSTANDIGMCFSPTVATYRCSNTNLNGATAWNGWNAQADYTAFASIYHSYRPVSGCVRMWSNSSSTTNQGELACALLPAGQALSTAAMGTFDQVAKRFGAFRGPLKSGVEMLWMPQDPASRTYRLKDDANSTGQTGGVWPSLVFAFTGAQNPSTITFEFYFNYELIPEDSTMNLVNSTAPYISSSDSEEATGIITKLGSFARPFGEDLGSWLLDQGAIAAGEIGRHLAGAAVQYVGNSIGRRGGVMSNVIAGYGTI